jgi:Ricin-type beta-trefoil lectin domain
MRKWKLAAAATVASGALAIGMFAAFTQTAKATTTGTAGTCSDTYAGTVPAATALTCSYDAGVNGTAVIPYPYTITMTATTTPADLDVTYVWSATCTEPSGVVVTASNGSAGTTEVGSTGAATLSLVDSDMNNVIDPTQCAFDAKATIADDAANVKANYLEATDLSMQLNYVSTAAASSSPTASPTASSSSSTASPGTTYYNNQVHGFDGTCMDDKGNSSAERSEVIIWQCNNTDQAQGWSYSGDELRIHGVCLNAKGNGKTGSRLILWSCNGGGNEIFAHRSNGEFAEKANGWSVCIDDPGYSTKNGTQLFVYHCNDGANQRFTTP